VRGAIPAAIVLALVNHQRAVHHERPLRSDARLAAAARDCPELGVLPCVRRHGYSAVVAAENTAWGYATAPVAMRAWMASSEHRANILDPSWRATGVAVSGRRYVQVFAVPP